MLEEVDLVHFDDVCQEALHDADYDLDLALGKSLVGVGFGLSQNPNVARSPDRLDVEAELGRPHSWW